LSAMRRCGLRNRCLRLLLLALMIATITLGLIAPIFSQTTYQIQLYPIADAYVTSQYPNTNYGADSTVRLYKGSLDNYYLIKFNLTGVITQQMPNLRFYLKLYILSRSSTTPYYLRIHPYSNNWSEENVTWSIKPEAISYTSMITYISASSAPAGSYATIDITNYVISNCLNRVCSFAVVHSQYPSNDDILGTALYYDIATREHSDSSKWPHLLIQYQALTTVTQNITVTSTETVTNTETMTVTDTVTHTVTETVTEVAETVTITTTRTITDYVTETETMTVTQTDIIYMTQTAYITQTATVTNTITDLITETATQTVTLTETVWAEPVTVTRTITVTPTVTETVTANATETGELFTGEQFNQIVIAIMAIGLIVSILGVLLKASGGE